MRTIRLIIAAVLVGSCLLYIAFGQHKGLGIGVGIIVVFLCRWLVIDHEAIEQADRRREARRRDHISDSDDFDDELD